MKEKPFANSRSSHPTPPHSQSCGSKVQDSLVDFNVFRNSIPFLDSHSAILLIQHSYPINCIRSFFSWRTQGHRSLNRSLVPCFGNIFGGLASQGRFNGVHNSSLPLTHLLTIQWWNSNPCTGAWVIGALTDWAIRTQRESKSVERILPAVKWDNWTFMMRQKVVDNNL